MKIIKLLLFLIIIAIVAVVLMFDNIAKYAVEKYGSEAAKTNISVANVDSDLLDKDISLNNLAVQNPPGFAGNALSVGKIRLKLAEISDDLIVVDDLTIDGVVANILQNNDGINLLKLKDNLTSVDGSSANKNNDVSSNVNNKKIIIKNLAIISSLIKVDSDLIKDEVSFPDIKLTNVGGDMGMDIAQFAPYLIGLITNQVQDLLKQKGIDMLEGKLEETLVRKIGDKLGVDVDTTDDIKEVFKQKTDNLQDKLEEQKDKLKNMFKF
jgi:hypothetical protein